MFDYPVTLETDADTNTVVAGFPDFPFCHSVGDDEDEALLSAVDALETALSFYVEERRPLPVPSPAAGRPTVRPSALECAKLGVYQAMTEQGVRKAELARRLGWHLPQVDRLLDLNHASRFDQIEAAARALGCTIEVRVASFAHGPGSRQIA
ncbi:type II toxin-antitoxin system HicB family antitoxin [Thiocystis violascens]|uniref:HicB-like antitoxin of toxin-antitoxin system domain-containing protein n=1 Tax=Thiocystis violascens (strain ATCC 17096 / DSM 198 / 6111) TaxID=765911 RepID=I3YBF8_THIV6|nr:type II toxin-antitoxin system HicB family antitoxin [Thiocystis violascens]AFL74326.1 hypothetical protein Thivi_2381 [Thiocystis violascens DSM 198]